MVWAPGGVYNTAVIAGAAKYLQDNQLMTYGIVRFNAHPPRPCSPAPNPDDLTRCASEVSGGSYADSTFGLPEIGPLIMRMTTEAIGASSSVVLPRSSIASTLALRVNGVSVPRSRSNGFDHDFHAKSLVFYGSTYRPQPGDTIEITFQAWDGSSG